MTNVFNRKVDAAFFVMRSNLSTGKKAFQISYHYQSQACFDILSLWALDIIKKNKKHFTATS